MKSRGPRPWPLVRSNPPKKDGTFRSTRIYDEFRLITDQLYLCRGMRRTKPGNAKLVGRIALDNGRPGPRVAWNGY